MAKVFSWKISKDEYAYILKQGDSYLSPKLSEDVVKDMAHEVNSWCESKFETEFNALFTEATEKYGDVGLNPDYKYYFDIINPDTIIITGKDGKNGSGALNVIEVETSTDNSGVTFENEVTVLDDVTKIKLNISGLTNIKGPKGDDGERGPEGPQGTTGEKGEDGTDGENGLNSIYIQLYTRDIKTLETTYVSFGFPFTFDFETGVITYGGNILSGNKGATSQQGPTFYKDIPSNNGNDLYMAKIYVSSDEKTCTIEAEEQWFLTLVSTHGKGSNGRIIYPEGVYDKDKVYATTETSVPYVLYNKEYYFLNWEGKQSGKTKSPDDSESPWVRMETFNAVYANVLLAEYANVGHAVFYNQYMFSQEGIGGTTNFEDFLKDKKNPEHKISPKKLQEIIELSLFVPNVLFDFKKGEGWFGGGNIFFNKEGFLFIDNLVNKYHDAEFVCNAYPNGEAWAEDNDGKYNYADSEDENAEKLYFISDFDVVLNKPSNEKRYYVFAPKTYDILKSSKEYKEIYSGNITNVTENAIRVYFNTQVDGIRDIISFISAYPQEEDKKIHFIYDLYANSTLITNYIDIPPYTTCNYIFAPYIPSGIKDYYNDNVSKSFDKEAVRFIKGKIYVSINEHGEGGNIVRKNLRDSEKVYVAGINKDEENSNVYYSDKLEFTGSGNLGAQKLYTTGSQSQSSDLRLKNILGKINNLDIEKILELSLVYYNLKDDEKHEEQIGVIAQELQTICPQLVSVDNHGYLSVDYAKLSILALYCIKDLYKKMK